MVKAEPVTAPAGDDALASSKRIARNATARTAGEIVGKAASLVFLVVMARELGSAGFGDYTFAVSLSTVVVLGSGFGTEELIAREVARHRERVHDYLANVVAVKVLTSLILLVPITLVAKVSGQAADALLATFIIAIGIAVENLGRTWHSVFTAYERIEMISISLVVQRVFTAAVAVALLLTGHGLVMVSIVVTVSALIGLAINGWVLRRYVVAVHWRIDRSRWIGLIKAGVPIGIATVLFMLLLRIDAALLGLLAGGEDNSEVGIYGAAFRLVDATLFISLAFSASTLPWLSRQGDTSTVARGYELGAKVITAVLMPPAMCFVLLAPQIIELLYGSSYDAAVLPLRMLGVVAVLYGINSLAATVLISRDRPKDFVRIIAVVVIANIVLNIFTIPRWGADAAAFNAALSGVVLAVASVVMIARCFGAVRPLRAFGAPLAGALAMSVLILAVPMPLLAAVAAGTLAYAAGALAFERIVYPVDLEMVLRTLPMRGP